MVVASEREGREREREREREGERGEGGTNLFESLQIQGSLGELISDELD